MSAEEPFRVASGYRTVSKPAVMVIAGINPIYHFARVKQAIYLRGTEVDRDTAAKEERDRSFDRWQRDWEAESRGLGPPDSSQTFDHGWNGSTVRQSRQLGLSVLSCQFRHGAAHMCGGCLSLLRSASWSPSRTSLELCSRKRGHLELCESLCPVCTSGEKGRLRSVLTL
ncbi:hypothetical protein J6590_043666 [Homalodisca vitripennis]|nr:hypothetical protein J6590_043666 [Homalodisca vitripennis]